jgi:sec-independent protein translocase protein TatB
MFDFGGRYTEILVLVVVAIIVIGPKDLPIVLRKFGQFMNKVRGMAREFQGHVDVAMKDAGMADIKKDLAGMSSGISGALAAPQTTTPVSSNIAPTMPQLSETPSSFAAQSDFSTYFGSSSNEGETWVAGRRVTAGATPTP